MPATGGDLILAKVWGGSKQCLTFWGGGGEEVVFPHPSTGKFLAMGLYKSNSSSCSSWGGNVSTLGSMMLLSNYLLWYCSSAVPVKHDENTNYITQIYLFNFILPLLQELRAVYMHLSTYFILLATLGFVQHFQTRKCTTYRCRELPCKFGSIKPCQSYILAFI